MIKKNASFQGLFVTIILSIILFFALFGYVSNNYANSGVTDTVGSGINNSIYYYNKNLTNNINDLRDSTEAISEADGNLIQIAWNGLTGIGTTIKVFFGTIIIATGLWNAVFPALSFLPIWFKLLVEALITVSIVLLILGAFKGESKT